jgi:hypothetical protein
MLGSPDGLELVDLAAKDQNQLVALPIGPDVIRLWQSLTHWFQADLKLVVPKAFDFLLK